MPTLTKLYSMEEAATHNKQDDCWVVIDGKVYDVTSYMDEHPGGDDVLLAVTGKDATDEFEDAGHSKDARELMEKYFIGELDESSVREIPELKIYKKEQPQDSVQKLVDLTKQYWIVPVSIITISVASCESKFLEDKPHSKGLINRIMFTPWDDPCFITGGNDHAVVLWRERRASE